MIGRVFWIGVSTVIELIKDRTIAGFFMVGVVMILGGYVIAEMAVVERMKMFLDTGIGAIFLIGVLTTLMVGANVVGREIRDREILCTLSKPISRTAWMIGKTGGFLATLGLIIFGLTLFCFLYVRAQMGIWVPTLFLGGFFIYLEMIILCGYTTLFSTITSQYLAIFFGFLVLIIGHMADDLRIYWANENISSVITKILFYIIPDLQSYLAAPVVYGQVGDISRLIFFLVYYSIMYLALAIVVSVMVINRKELD